MKLRYNSPVILTFTLLAASVLLIDTVADNAAKPFFTSRGLFDWGNPVDYFRLVTHAIGHANWAHLLGNFSLILLIGPILEEKYGSGDLLMMMGVTALVTGILNVMLFDSGLLGASGIVFMLILLSSFANFKSGEIPITFILVVVLFLGQEIWRAFEDDNISQFAHIIGGVCGGIFGFIAAKGGGEKKQTKTSTGIPNIKV